MTYLRATALPVITITAILIAIWYLAGGIISVLLAGFIGGRVGKLIDRRS